MKRIVTIIALIFISMGASALEKEMYEVDSLMQLAESQQGRDKLETMLELSSEMLKIDWDKSIEVNDAVIDGAHTANFMDIEAAALYKNGHRYMIHNDLDLSEEYLTKALKLYELLHDTAYIFEVNYDLALGQYRMGELDKAIAHYEKALSYAEQLGDPEATIDVLGNLGAAYFDQGNRDKALHCFERTVNIAETFNASIFLAQSEANLAILYSETDNWKKAKPIYERVLPLFERNEETYMAAVIYRNLGNIYTEYCVNFDSAMYCFDKAIELSKSIGMNDIIAESLCEKGSVQCRQGNYNLAKANVEEALAVAQEAHYTRGQTFALAELATIYFALKSFTKSAECAEQCIKMEEENGFNLYTPSVTPILARAYARLGRFEEMDALLETQLDDYNHLLNNDIALEDNLSSLSQNYHDMLLLHDMQVKQIQDGQQLLKKYRLAFFGLIGVVLMTMVLSVIVIKGKRK